MTVVDGLVLLLLHGTLVWFTQTHWYNNNNNNARTIFMVLSSCLKHCEIRLHTLVHAMNAARRQVAADLWI